MPNSRAKLAKLTRPHLHAAVKRIRLFKLFDQRKRYPVVWVSGPPGSGKTTLVASYLQVRKVKTFWYQVDEGDRDPATFFYYLGELAKSAASKRVRALPYLTPEHLLDLTGFARRYFRDFFLNLGPGGVLVLDNCQNAADPSFATILHVGAQQVPQDARLICISRAAPTEEFARLQVNDHMLQINGDDLRLTLPEARQIVAVRAIPVFGDVEHLYQRSNGWVAGLMLLLSGARALAHKAGELKSREALFRYFAGEVFAAASPKSRKILMCVALFPRITVSMAVALSGEDGAREVFDDLYQRQYFIDRKVDVQLTYQFHDLFREFLLARLLESRSLPEVQDLQVRAGQLLEAADEPEEAAILYRAAQAWNRIARLILLHAEDHVDKGRGRTLERWFEALPIFMLQDDPWLMYWQAESAAVRTPKSAYALFTDAYQRFVQTGDAVGQARAATGASDLIFFTGGTFFSYDRWIPVFVELLDDHPDLPENIRFRLWVSYFGGVWLRQPGHPLIPRAKQFLLDARAGGKYSKTQEAGLLASLMHCAHMDCDLDLGNELLQHLQRLADHEDIDPLAKAGALLWDGLWKFFNAQCEEAIMPLEHVGRYVGDVGLPIFGVLVDSFRVICLATIDRIVEAQALIGSLAPKVANQNDYLHGWYYCARARYHAAAHDFSEALRLDRLSLAAFERAGFVCAEIGVLAWLASDAVACGDLEEAKRHLAKARDRRKSTRYRPVDAVLYLVEAKILRDGDRLEKAKRCVAQSLDFARDAKLAAGLLLWCRSWLPEMLSFALTEAIEVPLANELVRRFKLAPPSASQDFWPWPVRICALGNLDIHLDGQRYQGKRKSQHKVLDLLKVLIAHGGHEISASLAAEFLWPDAEGDMAAGNLRTALHRLRKLLGDDAAVLLQDNKLSLNSGICWLDV